MPQKPPGDQLTYRSSFNALCLLCEIHSKLVTPFLRAGAGVNAYGLFSVVAGVFVYVLAHHRGDQALLNYWVAWLVATVLQRFRAGANRQVIHSQYAGRPQIAFWLCPFIKDEGKARFFVEPLICLGVGYGLANWSDALGKIVMSAAFSLLFQENFYRHVSRQREQEIIDARIESQALTNGVRERLKRGDWR